MVSSHLAVGEILRPQGIKGELKVRPITSDPDRFWDLKRAYIMEAGAYREIRVTVTRVDDGGAYLAMCSKDLGADSVMAWPMAEIAVMGPEGAARVLHKKEIAEASDPAAKLQEMIQEYRRAHANPYRAAEALHIDDIIRPSWTRRLLINRLAMLRAKRDLRPQKKHGNIPM